MYKFPITSYSRFEEIPLDKLRALKFSVCLLDRDWNFLFINDAAKKVLPEREEIIGKNMWRLFPEIAVDPAFKLIRKNIDKGVVPGVETRSQVNAKRISITGYPLQDCFYLAITVIPDRENLLDELRNELVRKRQSPPASSK